MHDRQIIHIHPQAPDKPQVGQPCNGCGVCCLAEPCPVGVLASRRLRGACRLVYWDGAASQYRCGMLRTLSHGQQRWWHRWAMRMIGAGQGCDASLEIERP